MKKILILGLIALLMIIGCSSDTVNSVQIDDSNAIETTKEVIQKITLDTKIKEILAKNSKVKSLKYAYFDSDLGIQSDFYWVKGDLIKVENFIPSTYNKEDLHTEVYLDRSAKTQKGYCRDANRCKGINPDTVVPPLRDFNQKTSLDWAKEITNGELINTETVFGRDSIKISTNLEGKETLVWIDTYYGLVLKLENKDRTIRFEEISANSVKTEEVTYENIE